MPAVGGGAGGGGRLHQAFVGIFTATTVVQRAFEEGDLIGLQGSTGAPVGYLAPVDIPVGSPAPGARNALWVSFGGSFAGVDRATFDAALRTKANASSLANYLQTSTYNIEKARLESGITGNRNNVSALQEAIDNLPSEVGDVTTDELTAAVQMLEQQIGNVSGPLFIYELWARSKTTTQARYDQGTPVDLDWTLADDVPDALEVDGDDFLLPLFYRGHVNLELYNGDTLLDKVVLEVESEQQSQGISSNITIGGLRMGRFFWFLQQTTFNGEAYHRIQILPSDNGQVFLGGLQARVYAEVALSRSDVTVNLDALTSRVMTAESDIDALESQTANIPVTSDVLWATSKVLDTTVTGRSGWIDVDWTLEDDVSDGVVKAGFGPEEDDFIDIPESLRGELHVDAVDGDDNVIARTVVNVGVIGNTAIRGIAGNRMRVIIQTHQSDATKVSLGIDRTNALTGTNAIPANTRLKVYAVSALPRNQIAGITQEQLIAALIPTSVEIFPKTVKPTKQALLDTLFTLELGKVFPPISNANRVIVTLNGSPIYNGVLAGFTDNQVIPMPIIDSQADNIATNINAGDEFLIVNVSFRLNNEPANLATRTMRVAIDRS